MKHIYLVYHPCKGSIYGVGTYIKNILSLIKEKQFTFHIVLLNANAQEVTTQTINGIEGISIPRPIDNTIPENVYYDNAVKISQNYIDLNAENIFHLNFLKTSIFAKLIKKHLKAKIILTIHYSQSILNMKGNKKELYKTIQKYTKQKNETLRKNLKEISEVRILIKKYADAVISVSQHAYKQNKFLYKIEDNKHLLIYNTVKDLYPNKKIIKPILRKKLAIDINEKIIVFAGRLEETKGIQCLLQALSILKRKGYKFHLFIVGEGNYDATLSFTHDLWTNITFTGFLEKKQLYKLLAVSDIGVCPSLYEEFGYIILEMMMFYLPVIAFNTSGPADIIKNNYTGLLADLTFDDANQSIKNLADKIALLLNDTQQQYWLGLNGRKRYLTIFSTDIFKKDMINLYKRL